MKKILVVVDMQKDFIDGSLGSNDAVERVLPNVIRKIEDNRKAGDCLIFTKDTHTNAYLKTFEGRHLPVEHCIKGTPGWELHEKIQNLPVSFDINCTTVEKKTFGSLDLKNAIEGFLDKDEPFELEFCGLCTDICVVSNVLICRAIWPEVEITVDSSCCGATSPETQNASLLTMKSCQINVK